MGKLPNVVEAVQHLQIKPEEILYLLKEMTKRHDEGQDVSWYTQVGILADRYPQDPQRSFAITERMQCLIELTKDQRMRGWTLAARDPKCVITSEAVFKATALARLRLVDDKLQFDADEFFDIVLSEADAEGSA